jgi:hypothetical protein
VGKDVMEQKEESGKLYQNLTDKQKEELNLAFNESFIPTNLLSHKEVKAQHTKWLEEK